VRDDGHLPAVPLFGTLGAVNRLENRSLDRAITVLETLARSGACTLADLNRQTGLPKSTLRRLLATFRRRGMVRKSFSDGRYRSNIAMTVAQGSLLSPRAARLVDAALPHMTTLTHQVGWPSDLHIPALDRMRVIESTRPLSPFYLWRGGLDAEVNMFGSASGLLYLSQLGEPALRALLARMSADPIWGPGRFGLKEEQLRGELADIRKQGYAPRRSGYLGETSPDDRLNAIAAPLSEQGRMVGAITMCWVRDYMSAEAFAKRHIAALSATARRISDELALDPAGSNEPAGT